MVSGQFQAPAVVPRERTPGTHCKGGWVGPRAGLDTAVAKRTNVCPYRESKPCHPVRSLVTVLTELPQFHTTSEQSNKIHTITTFRINYEPEQAITGWQLTGSYLNRAIQVLEFSRQAVCSNEVNICLHYTFREMLRYHNERQFTSSSVSFHCSRGTPPGSDCYQPSPKWHGLQSNEYRNQKLEYNLKVQSTNRSDVLFCLPWLY